MRWGEKIRRFENVEEKGVLINGNYSDSNRNVEIRLGGG